MGELQFSDPGTTENPRRGDGGPLAISVRTPCRYRTVPARQSDRFVIGRGDDENGGIGEESSRFGIQLPKLALGAYSDQCHDFAGIRRLGWGNHTLR